MLYQERMFSDGNHKATTMGEMLDYDRGIAYVLMQSGMHCVGCPSSIHESLEDACARTRPDVDKVFSAHSGISEQQEVIFLR